MRSFPLALLAALLLISGCCLPDLEAEPTVLLGTGEVEFLSIGDGAQDVALVNGVQGGWHVWGSVRATGLDWADVRMTFTLAEADGSLLSEPSRIDGELRCCEADPECAGFGELVGFPVILDQPTLAVGRIVTFTVEMTDSDGVTATAEKAIVPVR